MRKEQRDFILNKLRTAVTARINKESELRPMSHSSEDYAAFLESKGITVKNLRYASYAIELPPNPTHEANTEYMKDLRQQLDTEVSNMETALMLAKDPDAVALLEAALERIKGV